MSEVSLLQETKKSQLAQRIINDINAGEYQPGTSLPMQNLLTQRYQVSGPTLRKVLQALTSQGMLVKTPQGGMVVPVNKPAGKGMDGMADKSSFVSRPVRKLNIAAIWAVPADYTVSQWLQGMTKYTELNGLNFGKYVSTKGHDATLNILENAESYSIDGAIIVPYGLKSQYLEVIKKVLARRFPVVSLKEVDDLPLNVVSHDDTMGVYYATQYLIEKYRQPAYFLRNSKEAEIRFLGYRNCMVDAGYGDLVDRYTEPAMEEMDLDDWSWDKVWILGFRAMERLLTRIRLPASIVCVNDYDAQGVYRAAAKHNLTIGKDLFVVGFDDLPMAGLLDPPLTTINVDKQQLGFEACKLLHKVIDGQFTEPVTIHLPVKLIARSSA